MSSAPTLAAPAGSTLAALEGDVDEDDDGDDTDDDGQ
jgi:hypothetical protein